MINKTFNSIISSLKLTVYRTKDGNLGLKIGRCSIHLEPSESPALALAVLEATGVKASFDPHATFGTAKHLGHIQDHLQDYVNAQERAAAEAREQAELEAEALELRHAWNGVQIKKLGDLTERSQEKWLAVARRAREMRAEK